MCYSCVTLILPIVSCVRWPTKKGKGFVPVQEDGRNAAVRGTSADWDTTTLACSLIKCDERDG